MLEKYDQIEHSFPPMFVDWTIYEDENGDSSQKSLITEIEWNEITRLVFWCIKY